METMTADGSAKPGGGTLTVFEPPSGPGVRVDTYGYAGYRTNPNFDSLLAKLIVHSPSPDFADALARAERALAAFRLEGAPTNIAFLRALLAHKDFRADKVHTRFVDEQAKALIAAAAKLQPGLYFQAAAPRRRPATGRPARRSMRSIRWRCWPSARPRSRAEPQAASRMRPKARCRCRRRCRARSSASSVEEGDAVAAGQPLLIMDAMKMQHEIRSPARGYVRRIAVEAGETDLRGPCAAVRRGGRCRGEGRGRRGEDRPRLHPPRPRGILRAPRHDARRQAARRGGAPAQDQPAHGAAEPRRPGRSRQLRRIRRLRHRQPADAAHAART